MSRMEGKLDATMRVAAEFSLKAFDAYCNMTQTSAGQNQEKQKALRSLYFDFCNITEVPNAAEKSLACCVLTGRSGDGRKDTLKLAHLVPASTSQEILDVLNLSNDENGGVESSKLFVIMLEY